MKLHVVEVEKERKYASPIALPTPLAFADSLKEPLQVLGTKRPVHSGVQGAFTVEPLITAEEARSIVQSAEAIGFGALDREFLEEERNNERVMVLDTNLASCLWERLASHFTSADCYFVKPVGFGNEGVWRPWRLNECLKISRYKPGMAFAAHMDGPWVPRDDESSIFTLLVYLNSTHWGEGQTMFMGEGDMDNQVMIAAVTPKIGHAVCFLHDTVHSSAAMVTDVKYILRTEVMFRRINTSDIPLHMLGEYAKLPTYKKMVRVYAASQAAFESGDVLSFTQLYKEAIQIQREASLRPAQAQRFGRGNIPFPADVCVMIFMHLDIGTLLTGISLVSKQFRELSFDGRIWKGLYERLIVKMDFDSKDESIPAFLRRLKGTLRYSRMRQALVKVEDVTPPKSELQLAFSRHKQRSVQAALDPSHFHRFRREANRIRNNIPCLALQLGEEEIIIASHAGFHNSEPIEVCSAEPAYYVRISSGYSHYRTTHSYFGSEALKKQNEHEDADAILRPQARPMTLPEKLLPTSIGVLGDFVQNHVRTLKIPTGQDPDGVIIVEPPWCYTVLEKKVFAPLCVMCPTGFASLTDLLLPHYGATNAIIVGIYDNSVVFFLYQDTKKMFPLDFSASALAAAVCKFAFDEVIFVGEMTHSTFEANVDESYSFEDDFLGTLAKTSHLPVKVLNKESTALERKLLLPKLAVAMFRSCFFEVPPIQ